MLQTLTPFDIVMSAILIYLLKKREKKALYHIMKYIKK